jgi:peptidoglycan/LPS O-acetylase OafA/YrhL
LRLAPLYTLVWLISLVFMTDLRLDQPGFYKAALLYLTCLYPFSAETFFPPGNWVMWSLGAEIWFSVLFPVAAVVLHRIGWSRGLALVLLGAFGVRVVGQHLLGNAATPLNFISDSVFGRLDEFILGMYAAHLYRAGFQASSRHLLLGIGLLLVGALIWAWRYLGALPPLTGSIANDFVDFGVLFITLSALTLRARWVAVLQQRWLQLLGVMCYSIYMWHGIVQLHFKQSLHAGFLAYASYLAVVLAISAFTFRYIEFRGTASWRELIPTSERVVAAAVSPTR